MGMTIDEAIDFLEESKYSPYEAPSSYTIDIAIDTMRKYQIIQTEYNARLKADLVVMLTEIQLEIEELNTPPAYQDEDYFLIGTNKCSELIQQKIDKLKAESEGYVNFADDLIPIMNEVESEGKE